LESTSLVVGFNASQHWKLFGHCEVTEFDKSTKELLRIVDKREEEMNLFQSSFSIERSGTWDE
jgi:hypothetical protein